MRFAAAIFLAGVLLAGCSSKPDPQAQLKRGSEFLAAKKYPEAIIELRGAIQADPRLADARIKLADAYLANNNGAAAIGELVRAHLRPTDTASVSTRTWRRIPPYAPMPRLGWRSLTCSIGNDQQAKARIEGMLKAAFYRGARCRQSRHRAVSCVSAESLTRDV